MRSATSALRHHFETARLAGLEVKEVINMLLAGAMGEAPSLVGLLSAFPDRHEALCIAESACELPNHAADVYEALLTIGILPLSLPLQMRHSRRMKPFVINVDEPLMVTNGPGGRMEIRRYHLKEKSHIGKILILPTRVTRLLLVDCDLEHLLMHETPIRADLIILACEGRARLPWRIEGRVEIGFTNAKLIFPEEMHLKGGMTLHYVMGICSLPKKLVATSLHMKRCPNVLALPSSMPNLRELKLIQTHIRSLTSNLPKLARLHIANAPSLRQIELQTNNGIRIDLFDLPALKSFALNTASPIRTLKLEHCPRLSQLIGPSLHIKGDLVLKNLPELKRISKDLRVDGRVIIEGCPRLPKRSWTS